MHLDDQSYVGKWFRPRPVVHMESDSKWVAVVTPWGAKSTAEKVIHTLKDYLSMAGSDSEVTSPFQKLTCLSETGNILRVALILANDAIYREDNRSEYTSGFELFLGIFSDRELTFASIGSNQILLQRSAGHLIPLHCNTDFVPSNPIAEQVSPLPSQLLGLHSTSNYSVHSVRFTDSDHLILIQRSYMNKGIMGCQSATANISDMVRALSSEEPHIPFWIGRISL